MIQLYYMAVQEREHRFDMVFSQLDVVATFLPVVSIPSLTAFITRDKAVNQQDFILCDLTDAPWSDEHILSAVQMLRRFSVAKPVFLAPGGDRITTLYKALAEQRIDGLITDDGDPSEILAAVLRGDEGYVRRLAAVQQAVVDAANQQVSPLRIVPGLVLDVAVCGAQPRIGATTQAVALYHYLGGLGFRPVLLHQGQTAFSTLLELYRDRVVVYEDHVEINGIRLTEKRSSAFDAYIQDYGVLTPEWAAPFCAADLSVLVGGVKPWELPLLAAAQQTALQGKPGHLVTLLSFAAPDDVGEVREYLGDCGAVAYHPDIWSPGSDSVYRAVVLPALRQICGQS